MSGRDEIFSELCSICHIRPHKYRCPRCSARTCSLPCVKRHKQWSQCNGIRDPSVYIKRSELTTPRGVDHDYNYLTSIERQLESADRGASQRGIIIQDDASLDPRGRRVRSLDGVKKGDEPLRRAMERCGVIVERAPEGMAKNKQNTTIWHKKKRVIRWAVEWIHPDGRSEFGSCLENEPPAKAYSTRFETLASKREDEEPRKKRRKNHKVKALQEDVLVIQEAGFTEPTKPAEGPVLPPSLTTEAQAIVVSQENTSAEITGQPPSPDAEGREEHPATSPQAGDPICNPILSLKVSSSPTSTKEPAGKLSENSDPVDPGRDVTSETASTSSSPLHFYLHAPRLPSPCPVLIPLSPEATLSDCLQNRLVLEFPTIYVRNEPADKLRDDYITEEAFFTKMQENGYRERIEAKLTGSEEGQVLEELKGLEDKVDEKKLEEVLKSDLKQLQGTI